MIKFDSEVVAFQESSDISTFRNLRIYTSDKWTAAANAAVRNFVFKKMPRKKFFFVEEARLMVKLRV